MFKSNSLLRVNGIAATWRRVLCVSALVLGLSLATRAVWALDPTRTIAQYSHDSWGVKDGLPEGSVLALLPTSDGYLWLGTQGGLARFDGYRFVSFESGRLGLKQHSFGRDLLETSDGSIWAALVGGVARYANGKFDFFDEQQGLEHPFVYALAPGPSDTLWLGTGGTGVWRLEHGAFTRHPAYDRPANLPGKVNDLAADESGLLWVATDHGLLTLGSKVHTFTADNGLPSSVVNVVVSDRNNGTWVGTRAGLAHWDGAKFSVYTTAEGLPQNDVTALLLDRDHILWIGTRAGNLARMAQEHIESDSILGDRSNRGIFALSEDQEGALWLGTGRGLERLRNGAFVTASRDQGMTNVQILNITPRRAGGLWVLDGSGALLVYERGRARIVAPAGSVPGEGMLGMFEGDDGSLWLGGQKLQCFRDGQFTGYANSGGEVAVIATDGPELLLAQTTATSESTLWHFSKGAFTALPTAQRLTHVQRLYRDRRGRLWISTGGEGLVRIDGKVTRKFRKADGLPHDVVYGIDEDESGSLWVATRGGLARIRDDQVVNLAAADDLPRRSPVHVQHDGQGYLWITADDGIFRASQQSLDALADGQSRQLNIRKFTTADGLKSVEVSWRCSGQAQTADGRLWYATARGLSVVDPKLMRTIPTAPKACVENLLAGGISVGHNDGISIGEGREHIEFHYTSPSLNHADQLQFRYRLVGYDANWVDARARRIAYYTNVPPGNYQFRVAARLTNGPWGNDSSVIRMRVEPRWYETRTAKMSFGCAALLGLLGLYQLRVRQLRHRERVLVKKVAERTEELRLEVQERRKAEQEVRRLNEHLEHRVRKRTSQYEKAINALADDIAKRQRAEAALADEKERLAVTLRSIADGVITTDLEGRIILMNPVAERHTGWSSREAAGNMISDVFAVLDRSTRVPLQDPASEVLGFPGAKAGILNRALMVSRTGQEILLDVSAAPIHDRLSRVVGAVLVFRDVTERTRVEDQIQKTQKLEAVGILAGGIAHDFNNLLTGIFGHVDLARATLPSDSPAAMWLSDVVDVLDNARSLARQLLTFSSGGRPATESHSLGELLRHSTRFVLSGSNVAGAVVTPDDLWPCDIDPVQIRQAVDNLVLNARQAMLAGGHVSICASNVELMDGEVENLGKGRYVQLSISDDGPGMTAQVQSRIFDPFFTTKPTGSGLGLATVYSIVTQHGGSVDFESVPGKGTTFRLYLRAATTASVSFAPRKRLSETEFQQGTGRILCMDDEYLIRKLTCVALEGAGYTVQTACDGGKAIEIFQCALSQNAPFDLVILDLTVAGGMGGAETLLELRKLDPRIRAIASSGYSSGDVLTNPKAFGFSGTLPKPFKLSDLIKAVHAALRSDVVEIPLGDSTAIRQGGRPDAN